MIVWCIKEIQISSSQLKKEKKEEKKTIYPTLN
jgi:hypothetical protein